MPWPQYYLLGDPAQRPATLPAGQVDNGAWDAPLVKSANVGGIPCVFILDADGNLRFITSGEGVAAKLEELMREPAARRPASATTAPTTLPAPDAGDAALRRYRQWPMPAPLPDDASEADVLATYEVRRAALLEKVAAGEAFLAKHPQHAEADAVLFEVLDYKIKQLRSDGQLPQARQLIAERLARGVAADVEERLRFQDLMSRILDDAPDAEDPFPLAQELAKRYPADRDIRFWMIHAAGVFGDPAAREDRLRQAAAVAGDTPEARAALGTIRRLHAVGKPFDFAFDDATTGRRASDERLRGKVLIVDFWASWCGICLWEYPELQAIKDRYPDEVEIVGINLDDAPEAGGREACVAELVGLRAEGFERVAGDVEADHRALLLERARLRPALGLGQGRLHRGRADLAAAEERVLPGGAVGLHLLPVADGGVRRSGELRAVALQRVERPSAPQRLQGALAHATQVQPLRHAVDRGKGAALLARFDDGLNGAQPRALDGAHAKAGSGLRLP